MNFKKMLKTASNKFDQVAKKVEDTIEDIDLDKLSEKAKSKYEDFDIEKSKDEFSDKASTIKKAAKKGMKAFKKELDKSEKKGK